MMIPSEYLVILHRSSARLKSMRQYKLGHPLVLKNVFGGKI